MPKQGQDVVVLDNVSGTLLAFLGSSRLDWIDDIRDGDCGTITVIPGTATTGNNDPHVYSIAPPYVNVNIDVALSRFLA